MRKLFSSLIAFSVFCSAFFLFAPQAHAQVTPTYGNMAVVTAGFVYKTPQTGGSPYITSITYCGQPMTNRGQATISTIATSIWTLANPPSGNCQITATFNKTVKEKNFTSTILKNVDIANPPLLELAANSSYKTARQSYFVKQPNNGNGNSIMICSVATHPEGGANLITPMAPKVIAIKSGQLLYHAVGLSIRRSATDIQNLGLGWNTTLGAPYLQRCANFALNPSSTLQQSVLESLPAATPSPVANPNQGITAKYYDNKDLTNLKTTRVDVYPSIPGGTTNSFGANLTDGFTFSTNYEGYLRTTFGGPYVFHVEYDDAARIWLNDQLIFDKWTDLPDFTATPLVTTQPIILAPNTQYKLKIDYYQNTQNHYLRLTWQNTDYYLQRQIIDDSLYSTTIEGTPGPIVIAPGSGTPSPSPTPTPTRSPSPTPTPASVPSTPPAPSVSPSATPIATKVAGLTGKYYNNMDFTNLVTTRTDARINNNWFLGAPLSTMGGNTYTIRWTGFIKPPVNGVYIFYTQSDDGVRLFLNGNRIIDKWVDHTSTEHASAGINLNAGQYYPIRVDYKENTGNALIQLKWSYTGSTNQTKQIIPATYLFH